jgi:hypothetical protein
MTFEQAALPNGGVATVKLHGTENVVLILRDDVTGVSDPIVWGFETVADWRAFLKACVRFDEQLGAQS